MDSQVTRRCEPDAKRPKKEVLDVAGSAAKRELLGICVAIKQMLPCSDFLVSAHS